MRISIRVLFVLLTGLVFMMRTAPAQQPAATDIRSALEALRVAESRGRDTTGPFVQVIRQTRAAGTAAIPELIAGLRELDRAKRGDVIRMASQSGLAEIGKPAIPPLAKLLSDPSVRISFSAANALAQIGGAEVINQMEQNVKSNNFNEAQRATCVLGAIGGERSLRILASLLRDVRLHNDAAENLLLHGQEAIPFALDALRTVREDDPPSILAAFSAARVLGRVGTSAMKDVIGVLEGDNNVAQGFAMYALELMGRPSVPVFIRYITRAQPDQKARDLRGLSMQALSDIGPAAVAPVIAMVEGRATSANPAITAKAGLTILGTIRDRSAARFLRSFVARTRDRAELQALARWALEATERK